MFASLPASREEEVISMSSPILATEPVPKKRAKRKTDWSAYGYLSPALISILVLSILPILYTCYIAFTDFNQNHFDTFDFVGFKNFGELLNPNSVFYQMFDFVPTLIWTCVFAIVTTLLNYGVGLFLAVLLNNKNMKEAALYRSILILPWAVPSLISILIWQGLLNDQYGQINGLLHFLHLPTPPWLLDPTWARISVLLVNLWLGFPYMMTMCLGALQAVPGELYEAGSIDGANWWKQFRYITVPSISRISIPPLISSFAFNFNNFNIVYLLNSGGPARPDTPFVGYTDVLASASYKMSLQFNRFDISATISIILFVIVGVLSLIQMRLSGAFVEEGR